MDVFFADKHGKQLVKGDKLLVTYMGVPFEATAVEGVKFDWVLCKIENFPDEKLVSKEDVVSVKSLEILNNNQLQEVT